MILESKIIPDKFTNKISKVFDFDFDGNIKTEILSVPDDIDDVFKIGLIIGSSGSGKSTILKSFGEEKTFDWDRDKAICSHFADPDDAIDKLTATGLNSIPSMLKPYHVLSNGEKYRAMVARTLESGCIIDEFTSVVDRNVAKSMSVSIRKYVEKKGLENIVLASCHKDIVDWVDPDWVFDLDTNTLVTRGLLRQFPEVKLEIIEVDAREKKSLWEVFKKYHYLSAEMNSASRCYAGVFNGQIVAFSANLCLPGRIPPLYPDDNRGKFRESRLVVLPDFQGLGIGTRFSNAIGDIFLENGYRYFSKTAHIRMGEYRQKNELWRPTSTNLKDRAKSQTRSRKELWHHLTLDTKRICYSHEYIGPKGTLHRDRYDEYKNR